MKPQLWCCSYCLYICGMDWLSNTVQKRSSGLWGGRLKGVHWQLFSHSTTAHHSILVQSSALLCEYNPGVPIVANYWREQIAAKLLSACLGAWAAKCNWEVCPWSHWQDEVGPLQIKGATKTNLLWPQEVISTDISNWFLGFLKISLSNLFLMTWLGYHARLSFVTPPFAMLH